MCEIFLSNICEKEEKKKISCTLNITMITSPVIETSCGPVRGLIRFTETAKIYNSFEGIPYAESPVGELRFRDPQPRVPWTDVFPATEQAPPCYHLDVLQASGPAFLGASDCLTLNVYTSDLSPRSLLPVLVYVHEGGFQMGSSSVDLHGPDYLLEQDVIVVTFNYRLGVWGFLSFENRDLAIPGNAGLKDQVMAFKWVQQNIEQFGGDAGNITAIGIDSGAASLHYHLISPMSEGIFQRAILMSASALNPWASIKKPPVYNLKLAQLLGYQGTESDEEAIFKTISSVDPQTLTLASLELLSQKEKLLDIGFWSPFLPTVEPYESEQCFLPKAILELGRHAWSKDIDVIIGGVSDEGLLYGKDYTPEIAGILNGDHRLLVPQEVRSIADGQELKKFYFGETITVDKKEAFIRYMGDKNFWHGIYRLLLQRLGNGSGKTYLYYLASEHAEQFQFLTFLRKFAECDELKGTSHGDEIPLIFRTAFDQEKPKLGVGAENSKQLLEVITNFAKGLKPREDWLPIEAPGTLQAMVIRDRWSQEKLPVVERMKIWDSLYDKNSLC